MKAVNQNTSGTAGVRGSPGGSSVPAAKIVYHEKNGELLEVDYALLDSVYELTGRFQPSTKVENPDGHFIIEKFNLTIVSKFLCPRPGLSEHIIYVQGGEGENDE
ncbi:MAG: hypothetical protein QXW52_08680 [Candidatus Caldarchaeum sp.]